MNFKLSLQKDSLEIEDLFLSVFTEAEGEAEGTLVAALVKDLLANVDNNDVRIFVAEENREQHIKQRNAGTGNECIRHQRAFRDQRCAALNNAERHQPGLN